MTDTADSLTQEVLSVNQSFYDAFQALDLDGMRGVWTCTPADVCIHPGWDIHRGWAAIRESWRAIFAGTGYMRFEVSDVNVQVHGSVIQLTCIENIYAVTGSVTHHSRVACTNLFVETELGWRLTLHHGSPVASSMSHENHSQDQPLN
jgi:ketosteroid isomerase-like protein